MDKAAIQKYVEVARRALDLIEKAMADNSTPASAPALAKAKQAIELVETAIEDNAHIAAREKHIADLLAIDCWPEAISARSITKPTLADQVNRAISVLDMMLDGSIEGMHFLDFGCGDGYIAREALVRGVASSTGYDPVSTQTWDDVNVQFTTDFSKLKKGFYDVIFMYDVIDHCFNAEETMKQVKQLLKPTGKVYIRCHPWTSKHGSHLFKEGLNKAYIHLFLKEAELKRLGYKPVFTRMEKNPLEAYRWFFHEFVIEDELPIKEPLGDFFLVPAFKELVLTEQEIPANRSKEFFKDMEIQFVDFILRNQ